MKKLRAIALCILLLSLCACGPQAAPEEPEPESTTSYSAGYFDMVWGWQCPEGSFAQYINQIYHTEHGTAGSSGKAAKSAVALLALSKAFTHDDAITMEPVFASMNDAQARFFASQWLWLRNLADSALNDPAQFLKEYGWAGLEDFDASLYSMDDVVRLDNVIAFYLCRDEMR